MRLLYACPSTNLWSKSARHATLPQEVLPLSRLQACLTLLLLASTLPTQAADRQVDLLARFVDARDKTNLVTAETSKQPWHIAATFDLVDADGKVKEKGTFDEWWADKAHWRQSFASPSFKKERLKDDTRELVSNQAPVPYLLDLMLRNLVAPLPHFGHGDPVLKQVSRTFNGHPFDCITTDFTPGGKSSDPSRLPLYCFDHGTQELRFTSRFTWEMAVFNRPGQFLQKNVNLDLTILEDYKPVLHAVVTALQSTTSDDPHFQPEADLVPQDNSNQPTPVASPPKRLKGPQPSMPLGATRDERTGVVLLNVIVATNGQVVSAEPLFATNQKLQASALEAVKRWTFEPYTIDGKPIEIVTPIRINFEAGR